MNPTHNIGLVEIVSIIVGLFVVLGVFLALAKWIMYLTVKPIWAKLDELSADSKSLRDSSSELSRKIEVASADNKTLVSQSMVDVVQEVGRVSTHYSDFRQEMENRFAAVKLDLAQNHVTKNELERELMICRKTTHGV